MPLVLSGSTGIVEGNIANNAITNSKIASMAASKLSGQVPDANAPSGSVIQVVQAVKTDTSSTSGTSFVELPGLAATIVPSSSSNKILVCWTIWFGQTLQYHRTVGTLQRNINGSIAYPFIGNSDGSRVTVTWGTQDGSPIHGATYCATGMYLDTPLTTSSTTYNFVWSGEGGTAFINRGNEADGDNSFTQRLASSLIVMEIAA
jgi:hypothetical protein